MTSTTNKSDYSMFEEDIFAAWKASIYYQGAVAKTAKTLPTLDCNTNPTTTLSGDPDRCMILTSRKNIPYTQITRGAVFSNLYSTATHFSRMRQPNPMVIISYDDACKAYREAVGYAKSPSGLPVPTFDIIIGFTNDSHPIYIGKKYFIVNPTSFEISHVAVTAYSREFAMSNTYFIYKDKGAAIEAYKELVSKCEVKAGDIVIDTEEYLASGTKVYYRLLEKCERLPEKCPLTTEDCYVAVAYANFEFPEIEGKKVDVESYKPTCICSKDSIRSITEAEQEWLDMRPKNVNIKMGDLIQVFYEVKGKFSSQLAVITGFPAGLVEILYSADNDLVFTKRGLIAFTDIINSFGNFESLPKHIKQWFQKVARVEGDIVKQCRKEVVKPIEYKELDVIEFKGYTENFVGIYIGKFNDSDCYVKFDSEVVSDTVFWAHKVVKQDEIARKLGTLKPGLNKPESLAAIEKLIEANKAAEPKFVMTLDSLANWDNLLRVEMANKLPIEEILIANSKGVAYTKLYGLIYLINQVESDVQEFLYSVSFYEGKLIVSATHSSKSKEVKKALLFNTRKGAEFSMYNHKELWLQILTNDTTNQSTDVGA